MKVILLAILSILKWGLFLLKTELVGGESRENYFGLFGINYSSQQYLRVLPSTRTDLPNTLPFFLSLLSSLYQKASRYGALCPSIYPILFSADNTQKEDNVWIVMFNINKSLLQHGIFPLHPLPVLTATT